MLAAAPVAPRPYPLPVPSVPPLAPGPPQQRRHLIEERLPDDLHNQGDDPRIDHPLGIATVFSPILMTHFLLNVTGKKLLEKRMSRARPEYADYVARTPGFFPWFPRRS